VSFKNLVTPGVPRGADGREATAVVVWPAHLKKTALTAVVAGTILFAINQLNVVIDGHATTLVWAKTAVTYLVPFAVSNIGS
jgi:hypothetical protein